MARLQPRNADYRDRLLRVVAPPRAEAAGRPFVAFLTGFFVAFVTGPVFAAIVFFALAAGVFRAAVGVVEAIFFVLRRAAGGASGAGAPRISRARATIF